MVIKITADDGTCGAHQNHVYENKLLRRLINTFETMSTDHVVFQFTSFARIIHLFRFLKKSFHYIIT